MKFNFKSLLPKSKFETISSLLLIFCCFLYFANHYLPADFAMEYFGEKSSLKAWIFWLIDRLRFFTIIALIIVYIAGGLLLCRRDGFQMRHLLKVVFGIFICTAIALINFYQYDLYSKFSSEDLMFSKEAITRREKWLQENKNHKQYSEMSKLVAQLYYEREGVIVEYIDSNGNSNMYVPTAEDISLRDNLLLIDKMVDLSKKKRDGWLFEIVITVVLSFLAGWLIPIKIIEVSNQSIKRDV